MIPNPWDVLSGAAGSIAGWSWDQVATGIARWVLGAIAELIDGVLNFLKTAARPDVTDAWFSGSGSPYALNDKLKDVGAIGLGIIEGAEDMILDRNDNLYCGNRHGDIMRWFAPDYTRHEIFAHVGGQPLGFAIDTVDVQGALSSAGLVEEEIEAGLLDDATVETFLVNWRDPADFAEVVAGTKAFQTPEQAGCRMS